MTLLTTRGRNILALRAGGCNVAICDYRCFHELAHTRACVLSTRGSWGLSPCYIPCRLSWSEAFICICSCRPSVTTTVFESGLVSEHQQLKVKVVFVHLCQMQSKTNLHTPPFHISPAVPPPRSPPLLLISQECVLTSPAAPLPVAQCLTHWHLF